LFLKASYSRKLTTYFDATKFGLFAAVFSSAYKLLLCSLRRLGYHNDRLNAPIAGFLSALSLRIEAKGRKQLLLVLIMSRAVDSTINLVEDAGYRILPTNVKYVAIFMVVNLLVQGSMAMRMSILPKSLISFYIKWAQMTKNDQLLCGAWERMLVDYSGGF